MKRSNIFKIVLLVLLVVCFAFGLSACAKTQGEAETYYDVNLGMVVTFDGKETCDYGGVTYKYEIKNGDYYIYGDSAIVLKQSKEGVLALANPDAISTFETSARSGLLNESIYFGATGSIMLLGDGTFEGFDGQYALIAAGKYFYNDGVLMFEQTAGREPNGAWSTAVKYYVLYVEEVTGRMTDVLLKDPDYYKSWHFDSEDEESGGEQQTPDNPASTKHALTYDLDYDGLTVEAAPLAQNDVAELLSPRRYGYVFDGWYYNGAKVESGVWKFDFDVVLTAKWHAERYTITYNANGGELPENKLEFFTIESFYLPYKLPAPNKKDCNFAGWYEDENFSGEQVVEISANGLRDYVLYAKYNDEEFLEYELSFDGSYYSVVGFKGKPQYISVPATKDNIPVREIYAHAFEDCDSLISVVLPVGITKIGDCAFEDCVKLASINFPEGLTAIGDNAFSRCFGLVSVDFPEGLTSIGISAFYWCDNLSSVKLPKGLTSIGDCAFLWCESLPSVNFPEGLISIGDDAFYGCERLVTVTFSEGLISIGDGAFEDCGSLVTVTFPEGLLSIGEEAFEDCDSLTSLVLPDSVISVGQDAIPTALCNRYGYCYYLPTTSGDYGLLYRPVAEDIVGVNVHADCKTINSSAFEDCVKLASINFPEGLTAIGAEAFYSCKGLKTVVVPDSVTYIGSYAFSRSCRVFYKGDAESWKSVEKGESATQGGLYFFRADAPTDDGNYWHYAADEKTPEVWAKGDVLSSRLARDER